MAVSAKVFGQFIMSVMNKEIDWDTDTIKVMMTTSGYTPDQDTHRYKSSVTSEVTGTGYTAGGATLSSVTISYNASTNTVTVDAADVVWANSTIANARYAVIYDSTPASDATRPLIAFVDFGENFSSTAGPFTLSWDAAGIATLTAA